NRRNQKSLSPVTQPGGEGLVGEAVRLLAQEAGVDVQRKTARERDQREQDGIDRDPAVRRPSGLPGPFLQGGREAGENHDREERGAPRSEERRVGKECEMRRSGWQE